MKHSLPLLFLSTGILAASLAIHPALSESRGPEINFGRDVRPILSEHCFKCHGPDAAQAAAGLRLDMFETATKKLRDGCAITPFSPAKSKLLERVAAKDQDDLMPPPDSGMKPLTSEQVATLKTWISEGAKYEKHWAFVPPVMPTAPAVKNKAWSKNILDQLVLAKLEDAGLSPEPEADRDTLALRAAETLTGLPPKSSDLESFRRDPRKDAYEHFVDKLLSEPTYGEQQARYWLDAVRYGDTHGLQLDNERSVYPYRDWVVKAFNEDLPFTTFAKWQLAGDLLPHPTTDQLVATGYVRMNLTSDEGGAIPEEFLARNTFDRVDTTSTVFLGLTVQCAKCHDHKYDPIPQRDYYGLYAFFDSTQDQPLDDNIALPPPYVKATTAEDEQTLAAITEKMAALLCRVDPSAAAAQLMAQGQTAPKTSDWQISDVYSSPTFDVAFDRAEPPETSGGTGADWKPVAFKVGEDNAALIGKDNSSVYVKAKVVTASGASMTLGVSSDDGVKIWLNGKLIHSHKVSRGLADGIDPVKAEFRAGSNDLLVKLVNGGEPDGLNIRFADPNKMAVDQAVAAYEKSPRANGMALTIRKDFLLFGPSSADSSVYRRLDQQRTKIQDSAPMSLIAREMDQPRPTYILKRGQYDQKGDLVSRHVLSCLGSLPKEAPVNRLGLAEWLTTPNNPLFARVFANRVWQQYFGTGIVKTVDDFGSQGEWPKNQPLLDALAVTFMKQGWSVKQLSRMIVTSAAFRQSSRVSAKKLAVDPENRLISRGPRFRLDAEEIRDKTLAAGGLLVEKLGGRGFKPYQPDGLWEGASDPASSTHVYVRDHDTSIYRRSLYMFWKRTSPPPAMTAFDAPLRDSCIVRRSTTNTPLQALTTLNETGFLEASRTLAQRLLTEPGDDNARIKTAFERTLERQPTGVEINILRRALQRYRIRYASRAKDAMNLLKVGDAPAVKNLPAPEEAAWMLVCSSLMNTDEFFTLH